jgi:uncharacterized protein (TIGR01244 family)
MTRMMAIVLACALASTPATAAKSPPTSAAMDARADSLLKAALPGVLNATCPAPGLATAGQPAADDWKAIAGLGYRTVLDLRQPNESRGHDEPAAVRAAGLRYIAMPLDAGTLSASHFARFRTLIGNSRATPLFVHCASANRVGPLVLAWLVLDRGVPEAEAITRARALGMRSKALEDKALAYVAAERAGR